MTQENEKLVYPTINQYFSGLLDNDLVRIINVRYQEAWASTKQKQARIKIPLPREICDFSLKDLDNWMLVIVAIPREEIKKLK